ncbi:phage tail protein [Vibrio parahaemolyticus]|nr:phage tail protein [Vibrio parahaemolyticus]EJG0655181.1 phage tail protein [Vibrio parahaemolyticus]EJG0772107.1 phage tail protein [Vibrio parahaemolyticus]EJG0805045.1 phage tail protein [Vibrio parahaemolyticus]EJG0956887.1 phage tail protein [Vibrio parahaemolyticus]
MSDTNFTAIGQLVTEARNLLDSIKGGAIRKMEAAFDALKLSIANEWNGIKTKMNNEALAAIGRVDTQTVINAMGFTALNYNGDFIDTNELAANKLGHKNVYPLGMGVRGGRNDCFKVEIIPVKSGDDPAMRDPEAKALLDFMGVGRGAQHFSSSFNILKMTVLDTSFQDLDGYDFYIPNQHIKNYPTATFMAYTKIQGSSSVAWLGSDTAGSWKQILGHRTSGNPCAYTHVDLNFSNASVGDVVYLALPTICVGHFPKSKKHGLLYNPKTELIRKVDALHQA